MYEWMKGWALFLLQVPAAPPDEPAGAHDSVEVFRASPQYLNYLLLTSALGLVVVAAGMMVPGVLGAEFLRRKGLAWVGVLELVLVFGVIAFKAASFYVTTRLNYELRWYIVTDRSLRIREGVWQVREVTLTYANVQNLTVVQGPLQRWFGIADVIVETAGGGGMAAANQAAGGAATMLSHHGILRGIDNAPIVREKIAARLRAYREAGLGDPEDRGAAAGAPGSPAPGRLTEVLREIRTESGALRAALGG